jgi:signal transduction histidine kinase
MTDRERVDILLVDDNPGKVLALRTSLEPLGENIVAVGNGREALRHLLDRDFATVLLDVHMPGMDGFETAQLIRGRPRSAHTPIIFVSAINLADTDALRGYSLGAVDYIFAPIIPEVLRAKVSVFVELHRKSEEARRHARQVEERTRQLETSQQQLRLAERMAALGTLSAGLGHDMGNLLLPIQAGLESVNRAELGAQTGQVFDGIRTCIGHLRRLADGLRLLALDPDSEHNTEAATDFATWWPELEPVLRTVLPAGVVLESQPAEGLPQVRIARHLLTQVVFNLVQNAADALRPRGSGRVRVSAAPGEAGRTVRIEVADDGPGMTEEVQRRCFEPFFTTKLRGISTGLGLSLVNGVVRRAGGELAVRSNPGHGCAFSFELPAAGAPFPAQAAPRGAVVSVGQHRLGSLAASLLRSSGWTVHDSPAKVNGHTRVLLTDASPESLAAAETFLRAESGRCVLVLGDAAVARERGYLTLGPTPSPSALGRALQDAMARCAPRVEHGIAPAPEAGSPVAAGAA